MRCLSLSGSLVVVAILVIGGGHADAKTRKRTPRHVSSGLNATQVASAKSALKELRKLKSATEVGLTLDKYSDRVIDGVASINESLTDLPSGSVKTNISNSSNAYKDALTVWQTSAQSEFISVYVHSVDTIFKRYNIYQMMKQAGMPINPDTDDVFSDEARMYTNRARYVTLPLNIIWGAASKFSDQAGKALASGKR